MFADNTIHKIHKNNNFTCRCMQEFQNCGGVLRASVVKCLTRNPGVLGSNLTGSSGFFRGSVLGQDTSEPQPSTGETQEDMNNLSCRRDITEILLKATLNTIQSKLRKLFYLSTNGLPMK